MNIHETRDAKDAVAATALIAAAVRAEEHLREDRLFADPLAERLAGEKGRQLLAEMIAATGAQGSAQIVIRTRFWDDALLQAQEDHGVLQVVILAAGMDARAYRLPWRSGTTVYEVDQPQVVSVKEERLAGERPGCRRVAVGIDLADDWPKALESHGFSRTAKTAWLVEGLLQYIDAAAVNTLFARINTLSAPGSVLFYNVIGTTMLEAPFLQHTRQFMQQLGAPWMFGTDTPEALVEQHGWAAEVTDVAAVASRWNRWEYPVIPLKVPGVPRGYFAVATKASTGG